ncbi:hypothetical protein HJFPF1_02322 [Paramyrothecium foliicola]|nr:hypothetical protein HJFPF1_02322 [Paramyrothecium foliicola]
MAYIDPLRNGQMILTSSFASRSNHSQPNAPKETSAHIFSPELSDMDSRKRAGQGNKGLGLEGLRQFDASQSFTVQYRHEVLGPGWARCEFLVHSFIQLAFAFSFGFDRPNSNASFFRHIRLSSLVVEEVEEPRYTTGGDPDKEHKSSGVQDRLRVPSGSPSQSCSLGTVTCLDQDYVADCSTEESATESTAELTAEEKKQHMQGMESFRKRMCPLIDVVNGLKGTSCPTRIAIIDSGVDGGDPEIERAINAGIIQQSESKTFVTTLLWDEQFTEWSADTCGHGTAVAKLAMLAAPDRLQIFVGKVCDTEHSSPLFIERIDKVCLLPPLPPKARAKMSQMANTYRSPRQSDGRWTSVRPTSSTYLLGGEGEMGLADNAINHAIKKNCIIIAAASNEGSEIPRLRPANRADVLAVHATDALGEPSTMNPSPLDGVPNFATLGVSVPVLLKGELAFKSGTSFAVPFATGMAANILAIGRDKCGIVPTTGTTTKSPHDVLNALFIPMSENNDDEYDFIHPSHLYSDEADLQRLETTIVVVKTDEWLPHKIARRPAAALDTYAYNDTGYLTAPGTSYPDSRRWLDAEDGDW